MDSVKWKELRLALYRSLFVWTLLSISASFYFLGTQGAMISLAGTLCLGAGFFVTELLVGVLTGVKKANASAIFLLMVGKLSWWAGLFWLSRHLRKDWLPPMAAGMGAFLLALVTAVLLRHGMPKISDGDGSREP